MPPEGFSSLWERASELVNQGLLNCSRTFHFIDVHLTCPITQSEKKKRISFNSPKHGI